MIYSKTQKKNKIDSKKLLRIMLPMVAIALTSCCACSANKSSLRIYQTPTLKLAKGTNIQTIEGVYTTQFPEVWYSEAKYLEMVKLAIKNGNTQ